VSGFRCHSVPLLGPTQYREDLRRWRETLEVEQEPVTVEEMTGWLRVRLQLVEPGTEVEATALLEEQEMAGRRYCLFLGMLELVRAGEIGVSQAEAWGGWILDPPSPPDPIRDELVVAWLRV